MEGCAAAGGQRKGEEISEALSAWPPCADSLQVPGYSGTLAPTPTPALEGRRAFLWLGLSASSPVFSFASPSLHGALVSSPQPGFNPGLLHWELHALATGPPGKSILVS